MADDALVHPVDEGPLRVGDTFLGKYQILGVIGRGGHGRVYRAVNLFMGRQVALKILDRPGGLTEEARHRGQLEAGLLGRLEHPNIVRVYDAGISGDGQLYIVMELLKGKTLGDLLREEGPLEIERGLRLIEEVCGALEAAHAENAVHRDLKPANIFVTEDGAAKVLDFGVAKIVGAPGWQTQQNMVVGTCLYMSPEQIQGQPATPRSDVYALGLLAFEAFHGAHPILLDEPQVDVRDRRMISWLQVKKTPPRLDEILPGFPEYVGRLVHTALVKRPGARFETAREMADKTRICLAHYAKDKAVHAPEKKRFGKGLLFGRRPPIDPRELAGRPDEPAPEAARVLAPEMTASLERRETKRLFPKTEEQVIEDAPLPSAAPLAPAASNGPASAPPAASKAAASVRPAAPVRPAASKGAPEASATETWNEPLSAERVGSLFSAPVEARPVAFTPAPVAVSASARGSEPARTEAFGSIPDDEGNQETLLERPGAPSRRSGAPSRRSGEPLERRPGESRRSALERPVSASRKVPEPPTPGEPQSLSLTIPGSTSEPWRLPPRVAMALTLLTGCALGTSGAFWIHRTFFSTKTARTSSEVVLEGSAPAAISVEKPSKQERSAAPARVEGKPAALGGQAVPTALPSRDEATPAARGTTAQEAAAASAPQTAAPASAAAPAKTPSATSTPSTKTTPSTAASTPSKTSSTAPSTKTPPSTTSGSSSSSSKLPASGLPSSGLDDPGSTRTKATPTKSTSRSANGTAVK